MPCIYTSYHQWWHTSTHTRVILEHCPQWMSILCVCMEISIPPFSLWTESMTEAFMNQWWTHLSSSCINKHYNRLALSHPLTSPAVITCSKVMKAGGLRGWELVTDCDCCVCVSLKYGVPSYWRTYQTHVVKHICLYIAVTSGQAGQVLAQPLFHRLNMHMHTLNACEVIRIKTSKPSCHGKREHHANFTDKKVTLL